ncbi:SDR family NAD(P)-dependent oxidoreductase [Nocardiopsis sediminis]|uniref:SDR family NAD(P)-dependent oxidoreductase n=1 Tax=Nocardiopsis sediminis TaxID=1778267 RepID=A0ABV8FRE3_9ACTN
MRRSYVVTGGGRGVGRAVVERLVGEGAHVVAVEKDGAALEWMDGHPERGRLVGVAGDAGDEAVAERAADRAEERGPLAGWVNNAAVFRDASVHSSPAGEVLELIGLNLAPAVVGCAVAVRRFLAQGGRGAVVNVSSHQAQRAVPGCVPYVTAKAGVEGLTRALAVEYGARGVRVNAVALGSIATERYAEFLAGRSRAEAASIEAEMGRLHPVGRVGRVEEVAGAVAFLLSEEAGFINGATVPVDGGRGVLARDPESHDLPGGDGAS